MRVMWLALLAFACSSSSPTPPAAQPTASPPASQPSTPAAAPAPPRPTTTAATPAELAAYRQHMKLGWARQKEQKWSDAVPEFEAALQAITDDPRALAELGWSAMNAGDFAKARRVDEKAVAVALDRNVKAASLYNLGLVLEKTGDKDGALKMFLRSLELRPNKTVEQAVGRLGAGASPPLCTPGMQPCDCALAHLGVDDPPPVDPTCTESTDRAAPVAGFHVFHLQASLDNGGGTGVDYLFDERLGFVALIGIEDDYRHWQRAVRLARAEVRSLGGHRVLWLETATEGSGWGGLTSNESRARAVTVCVLGDDKEPARCPVADVPLSESSDTEYLDDGSGKTQAPEHKETVVDVTLAEDGTVTVKLVSGPADARITALMGPHRLW